MDLAKPRMDFGLSTNELGPSAARANILEQVLVQIFRFGFSSEDQNECFRTNHFEWAVTKRGAR